MDYREVAKKVLHRLELALETKVGVLEHELDLIEAVAAELGDEVPAPPNQCACDCRVCQMADHSD